MKIENVDSLIFDMDGTLWDAMKSYAEVWNVAFKEYGLDITVNEDVLKTGMGMNIGDIMEMLSKRYGFKISADTFIARVDEIEDELLPKIGGVLYPGVKAGLEHLSKNYRLFLCTGFAQFYGVHWHKALFYRLFVVWHARAKQSRQSGISL